jgi:hypothetical protein
MLYTFAKLEDAQLTAIQDIEREEGLKVLALREVDAQPDMIDAQKLARLQELEKQLGMCLIAVR